MVSIVLLRGPSAVGKTTIASSLLLVLKKEHKRKCAYICEDDFRKQLQFKYAAIDKMVHINSAELIQTVIKKLLSIDTYDVILIEGLFRYAEQLKKYSQFCKRNEFDFYVFQLSAPLEVRKHRNVLSATRLRVADFEKEHVIGTTENICPKNAIIIDTTQLVSKSVNTIVSKIS